VSSVFVSYRRKDTAPFVGRLCDRLKAYYGPDNVFLDIADLPYAHDFRDEVKRTIARSDVIIGVIGHQWCGSEGEPSRFDVPDDPVRIEIEAALAAKVPLVPVLLDGAPMPDSGLLPRSLWPLLPLNAVPVSSGIDFHANVDRLIDVVDRELGAKAPAFSRALPALEIVMRRPMSLAPLAVAAFPFVLAGIGVAPPWPPRVALLTTLLNLALILAGVLCLPRLTRDSLRRLVLAAAVGGVLATAGFVGMQATFVYQTPVTNERFVKGVVCSSDALLLYRSECPFLGSDQLQAAEYEADRLWTPQSIALVETVMLAFWFAASTGLAILCSVALTQIVQRGLQRR
jgi:hypothetical protein